MELADDTGRITFTSPAGDDNTKRPHHQKQKQQQQRSKPEFIKSVTIVDPVKESGHGIAISTSKSGSHGKVASRSSGPSPTMLQSGGNVRGIVKKGRERRDSEGMTHGERERGKGAGRKSAESRKASDGDSKTQSIAVQVIGTESSLELRIIRPPDKHTKFYTPFPLANQHSPSSDNQILCLDYQENDMMMVNISMDSAHCHLPGARPNPLTNLSMHISTLCIGFGPLSKAWSSFTLLPLAKF